MQSIVQFIYVSGFVGFVIGILFFPFACPPEVLSKQVLGQPAINATAITSASDSTREYLKMLEKALLNLPDIVSITADPYGFAGTNLYLTDIATSVTVVGPLRDLYGLPLVPTLPEIYDRIDAVKLPGGLKLFSFAMYARKKAFADEALKRQQLYEKNLVVFTTRRKYTVFIWLILTLSILFVWKKVSNKRATWLEMTIMVITALICIVPFVFPGVTLGSGFIGSDATEISFQEREALNDSLRTYMVKCLEARLIDKAALERLVGSLSTPALPVPSHFYRQYRTGSARLRYWGVDEFIARETAR
ncbi:MAG: hypothetical protein GQF41_1161 [Candidatus Rifleibacterium amylolyticum]|nr:MAG: hypothetical protein GQF41_1161 [Candidatus Rifleibacterium amylolyticum]